MNPLEQYFQTQSRRQFLQGSGIGLGAIALSSLLSESAIGSSPARAATPDPLAARPTHFAPRAKHVIYLHMIGAPSQLDLFDHKPKLVEHDGQVCPAELLKGKRFAFIGGEMTLAGSQYRFQKHGQSGQQISELLPHLATVADDITLLKGLHTDEINHAPAQMFLHTGFGRGGRPSFGSWVVYGLGSENQDLPAFVVMLSGPAGGAGTSLWSTGFLPSVYQGIQFRSSGDPVLFLSNPKGHSAADRRRVLDTISELNQSQLADVGDPEIATRINQYEMAFRMQTSVPELMDLSGETQATLDLYGAKPGKASFANNCLLARRLVERGVRMIQLYDSDWDHHNNLPKRLAAKCKDVDQAAGRPDHRPQTARPAGGYARHLGRRVRPDAASARHLRHRRQDQPWPRSPQGRLHHVAGRRRHETRHHLWANRRARIQCRREPGPRPRSERHRAALTGPGSQAVDLHLPRPRVPTDRRARPSGERHFGLTLT